MSVRLPRGIRRLFRLGLARPELSRDVSDEITFHLEETVRELIAQGHDPSTALERARSLFGDERAYRRALTRIDAGRLSAERRTELWGSVAHGVGSFLRSSARTPVLTAGIIATLALGIGANTTMYGIVDRILLQPPRHVRDADDVFRVLLDRPRGRREGIVTGDLSIYPAYRDLRSEGDFALAAYTEPLETTIGSGAAASDAWVASASANFFQLLGVAPSRGRFFTEEESRPGAPLTALVSAEYWRRALGADPDVLGRHVEIGGYDHRVVGVLPEGFTGIDVRSTDFWVPLEATHALGRFNCLENYRCSWMRSVARLPAGSDTVAVADRATALLRNRARDLGDPAADQLRLHFGSIIPGRGIDAPAEARLALWLAGVSLIVLLVAAVNVVSLLSARGIQRRREVAVRIALGAGRRRVVAQALAESVALAMAGGAGALLLARWGGGVLRSTLLPDVSFPNAALTPRVIGFTALAALLAGVTAGIGPALGAGRADLSRDLGRASLGNSASHAKLTGFMTNAQVALSVVLLVGAGLFVESMRQVQAADLGLDVGHLLQARMEFRDARISDAEALELYDQAVQRVSSLPGVRAATHVDGLVGYALAGPIEIPGIDSIPALPGGGPYLWEVSPGFFEATGVAIVRGRPIQASDAGRAAVINETMARVLWPGSDPLGRCLLLFEEKECTPVVGVAEDVAQSGYGAAPSMQYYIPIAKDAGVMARAVYVRTEGRPEELAAEVSLLLRTFSPRVRNVRVETLLQVLDPQVRAWRMGVVLFAIFGGLATTLAGLGLFAVLASDVQRRTRELGIRSALGASSLRLLAGVLARGTRLTGAGLAVGVGITWIIAPHMGDLLFQVSPRDPTVVAAVTVLLLFVAAVGSIVPALYATQVDPVESLKSE